MMKIAGVILALVVILLAAPFVWYTFSKDSIIAQHCDYNAQLSQKMCDRAKTQALSDEKKKSLAEYCKADSLAQERAACPVGQEQAFAALSFFQKPVLLYLLSMGNK